MAPDDAFLLKDIVPVVCVDPVGVTAFVGIAEYELVRRETDIPVGVGRNQQLVDHREISRGHNVAGFFKINDLARALLTSRRLSLNVDAGITFLECLLHGFEGNGQAAGVKHDNRARRLGRRRQGERNDEQGQHTE